MKTHIFGEHPFPMCSGHQNDPIHKFSCFIPQNNPHFVNSLHYSSDTRFSKYLRNSGNSLPDASIVRFELLYI